MFGERDGSAYPEMCDVLRWAGGGCHSPPNPPPPASSGSPGGLSRQSSRPPGQPSPVHFLNGTPAQTLGTSLTCLVVVELRVTSPQTPPFSMTRRDCFSLPPAPGLR